jgi:hypothetical protein
MVQRIKELMHSSSGMALFSKEDKLIIFEGFLFLADRLNSLDALGNHLDVSDAELLKLLKKVRNYMKK